MSAEMEMPDQPKIGVIGAGVMGRALIKGMLDAGLVTANGVHAAVNTAKSAAAVTRELGVPCEVHYQDDWIAETDVFLICTKPYRVVDVITPLVESGRLKKRALFISIAAGVSLAKMQAAAPQYAVIRAMPNTPCLIGYGVTVIAAGTHAGVAHMALAERIFSSVGMCLQLAEHHMDAVTAVSGSGPAYIYLMMEALADGAVKVGLPRQVAFDLVSQTMLGAAQMMQKTGKHPATLKDEVTTPAGCTISALLTMEDGKIRSTLARAVEEATRTAAGLG